MRIDKTNLHLFQSEEAYFHDQLFLECSFNNVCKEIVVLIEDVKKKIQHKIIFNNVECFEMVGGESWGGNSVFSRVIDWWCVNQESETMLKKLKEKTNLFPIIGNSALDFDNYLQSRFLLETGNTLDILCEYIEIDPIDYVYSRNKKLNDYLMSSKGAAIKDFAPYLLEIPKEAIINIDIVFQENNLPRLFSENGILSYCSFIDKMSDEIGIYCELNVNSSEVKDKLKLWIGYLVDKGYKINKLSIKCTDTIIEGHTRDGKTGDGSVSC